MVSRMDFSVTRELVKKVFERAHSYEWTLQGFGMLRLYLGKVGRIHVWNNRLAVPNVSNIHTHPWALRSTIIAGRLMNIRYKDINPRSPYGIQTHYGQKLQTGERGKLKDEPFTAALCEAEREHLAAGDVYEQRADEIHESCPNDGCVTVMERPKGPDFTEHAFVYWPFDSRFGWVSAEPRLATSEEIARGVQCALSVMVAEDSGP